MPFTSKAQSRYMFSVHPKLAEEFAKKTKSIKALPERKGEKEKGEKKDVEKRKPVMPRM